MHVNQPMERIKRTRLSAVVAQGLPTLVSQGGVEAGTPPGLHHAIMSRRNVSMKMRHFQQLFSVLLHRSQATAC